MASRQDALSNNSVQNRRVTMQETSVEAVVTFNKGIFNLVSKDNIERYIQRLMKGELIESQIKGIDRNVPIFLTFPTGWRYHRQYPLYRKASLIKIRTAICGELNLPEDKNPYHRVRTTWLRSFGFMRANACNPTNAGSSSTRMA